LARPNGALYFQPPKIPKEGIEGIYEEQIIEILHGCYGLADARHWRKSLVE
jgi:hypothetical protein